MRIVILLACLLFQWGSSFSQTTISGTIIDRNDQAIEGANVYLEGTYDGTSSNKNGSFIFETATSGEQNLIVSMIGYEAFQKRAPISVMKGVRIVMKNALNVLTGVTLSAGSFEAGDNSKVSVLKPLDIVTTAGAAGDFVAAMQTLPGAATIKEDGRLFVRGGEAGETQVFIDGLRVFQPFNATANNMPTRGRFSPFLFKGMTFSTGGYSAEYGQALSSVLLLNTTDEASEEKTDVSIMSVGGGLGHTKIWGKQSLSINTSYINLKPYQFLVPNNRGVRWIKPYESISGETVFRAKNEHGFFKLYTGFNHSNLEIEQEDINYDDFVYFALKNNNLYANASYKHFFDQGWTLFSGLSISSDKNKIRFLTNHLKTQETASHLKLKLKKNFSNRLIFNFGAEHFITNYKDQFLDSDIFDVNSNDNLSAVFAESDIFFSNRFAIKLGTRAAYSQILNQFTISPRVSIAYKSGDNGQFSMAFGDFYQNPKTEYLKYAQHLEAEKTTHYILNYQYAQKGKTFRAEGYYKNYDNLTKYNTKNPQFDSDFTNSGGGYATGLDLFWRANSSIKNLDYWLSYSYLNTKRDYRDFREKATPNFAPKHNLSLVAKYFINDWHSQVGMSYSYGAGRPYDNPNTPEFLAENTKAYQNLSLNWAYLVTQQKILYFSISNATGVKNIHNYQYADTPNLDGIFERRAIQPTADAFFFVGFFWTISSDKTSNQLDNL